MTSLSLLLTALRVKVSLFCQCQCCMDENGVCNWNDRVEGRASNSVIAQIQHLGCNTSGNSGSHKSTAHGISPGSATDEASFTRVTQLLYISSISKTSINMDHQSVNILINLILLSVAANVTTVASIFMCDFKAPYCTLYTYSTVVPIKRQFTLNTTTTEHY